MIMHIHHTKNRAAPLLALALTAAACTTADAQQGYGYPQQSGAAAPSTIPGRGDSEARVPVVDPAPVVMPVPRKPKPKPQPSPWGGTAPAKPTAPPVASKPPVTSQPPIAQPNGTPPSSGPQVVVMPGQNTPPPSQPQAGANDRLTSVFRGTRGSSTIIRGGAAAQTGSLAGGSTQRITSTVLACTNNGNTPKITRIQPANDASLQPGGIFIVHGLCFGDAQGKVQITLPTQFGRIQAHDAQILDWDGEKILAQLPDGIVKAIPGAASVEVASAAGLRAAGKETAFEPRWQLSLLPQIAARVRECSGSGAKNSCIAGDDTESDSGFNMPKNTRCTGIGTCFSSADEPANDGITLNLNGRHYTENDIDSPLRGRDRFEVTLQTWMRPSHCDTQVTAFATDGRQDSSAVARFETDGIVVDWAMTKTGDPGWLQYRANCNVWVPAGLGTR
jgi:hypothetical protein